MTGIDKEVYESLKKSVKNGKEINDCGCRWMLQYIRYQDTLLNFLIKDNREGKDELIESLETMIHFITYISMQTGADYNKDVRVTNAISVIEKYKGGK